MLDEWHAGERGPRLRFRGAQLVAHTRAAGSVVYVPRDDRAHQGPGEALEDGWVDLQAWLCH
jgi:hypothetical protein